MAALAERLLVFSWMKEEPTEGNHLSLSALRCQRRMKSNFLLRSTPPDRVLVTKQHSRSEPKRKWKTSPFYYASLTNGPAGRFIHDENIFLVETLTFLSTKSFGRLLSTRFLLPSFCGNPDEITDK